MLKITSIYKVPQPRQDWVNGNFIQRHDSKKELSVDLFVDLVFAALLYKLGRMVVTCSLSIRAFGKVFVIFWCICLTRSAIDEYTNLFSSNDIIHKLIYLVYAIGVCIMVMNINVDSASLQTVTTTVRLHTFLNNHPQVCDNIFESAGYVVGIIITRITYIILHLLVMRHRRAFIQFSFDILKWTITIIICLVYIGISYSKVKEEIVDDLTLILIILVICQETLVWCISRIGFAARYTYPFNLELLQYRWSLWIGIVFGQAVMQFLLYPFSQEDNFQVYLRSLLSLGLVVSFLMQYYNAAHRKWTDHAIMKSLYTGVLWLWLHPLLSFTFFCVGVSLTIVNSRSPHFAKTLTGEDFTYHNKMEQSVLTLLSLSCGLSTLLLTIMRMSHSLTEPMSVPDRKFYAFRIGLSILQCTVCRWGFQTQTHHLALPSTVIVLVVQVIINLLCFNAVDIVHDMRVASQASRDRFNQSLEKYNNKNNKNNNNKSSNDGKKKGPNGLSAGASPRRATFSFRFKDAAPIPENIPLTDFSKDNITQGGAGSGGGGGVTPYKMDSTQRSKRYAPEQVSNRIIDAFAGITGGSKDGAMKREIDTENAEGPLDTRAFNNSVTTPSASSYVADKLSLFAKSTRGSASVGGSGANKYLVEKDPLSFQCNALEDVISAHGSSKSSRASSAREDPQNSRAPNNGIVFDMNQDRDDGAIDIDRRFLNFDG